MIEPRIGLAMAAPLLAGNVVTPLAARVRPEGAYPGPSGFGGMAAEAARSFASALAEEGAAARIGLDEEGQRECVESAFLMFAGRGPGAVPSEGDASWMNRDRLDAARTYLGLSLAADPGLIPVLCLAWGPSFARGMDVLEWGGGSDDRSSALAAFAGAYVDGIGLAGEDRTSAVPFRSDPLGFVYGR